MLTYLGDLMEDTTDLLWQGAKAAHAVLLCKMEHGVVTWEDSDRIDRIRRVHAQNTSRAINQIGPETIHASRGSVKAFK